MKAVVAARVCEITRWRCRPEYNIEELPMPTAGEGEMWSILSLGFASAMSRFRTSRWPGVGKARRRSQMAVHSGMSLSGHVVESDTVLR